MKELKGDPIAIAWKPTKYHSKLIKKVLKKRNKKSK